MATEPTKNPIPSESPRDLKFNSGKVDEFVNSPYDSYSDRFGHDRMTAEGIRHLAINAIQSYGYITLDSFEDGATISLPNEVLRLKSTGEYYRWDGSFPKVVPAGSTPSTTGGVGIRSWVSVGDASLRKSLSLSTGSSIVGHKGGTVFSYLNTVTPYVLVTDIVTNLNADCRTIVYGQSSKVYVPKGVSVRCNFLPDDDVRVFIGEGNVLTKDIWGYEHVFNVALATKGSFFTSMQRINQAARNSVSTRIGIIGDSITDGAFSIGWSDNPLNAQGNLGSTNYNHNLNGGSGSWFRNFTDTLNNFMKNLGSTFIAENCGSSGKKLIDGWAYRNFDYGFFQNTAYANKAPDICFLSMGVNDNQDILTIGFDAYLDRFDAFIRKAWGYGCSVCLVSMNYNDKNWGPVEHGIKYQLEKFYKSVDYLDLASVVTDMYTNFGSYTLAQICQRPGATIFDNTHYSTIGHQYVGAYAAYKIMPYRVCRAVKGNNFLPLSDNDVKAIGFPSLNEKRVEIGSLSGNSYLDALSGWGYSQPGENVTFVYYIWCDDADVNLVIMEPYQPTYTTSSRANSVKLTDQDSRNGPYFNSPLASSGVASFTKKLTTHCGLLRKGLTKVEIIYDGAPSQAYAPALMFRGTVKNGAMGVARTYVAPSTYRDLFGKPHKIKDLLMDYSTSLVNDEATDSINGSLTNLRQLVSFSSIPAGGGVIFYYKASSKSGLLVQRSPTGLEFYAIDFGAISLRGSMSIDVSGACLIMAETVSGGSGVSVYPTSGAAQQLAVSGFSGGTIGLSGGSAGGTFIINSASNYTA